MLRATLRALSAYKLRLALSALSIILGVAFVAGTFIFTDSLKKAFDDLTSAGQADLIVSPRQAFETRYQSGNAPQTMPASLVDTVKSVDGVAAAEAAVTVRNVSVLGPDGKPLGNGGGPGSVGVGESWIAVPELAQWTLAQGVAPAGPDQVVVDENTADKAQVTVGGTISAILPSGATVKPQVVGIAKPTLASAGASVMIWSLPTAETLLTAPGQVTSIRVQAAKGVTQNQLQERIAPLMPPDVRTQTGEQVAGDMSRQLNDSLGFLNTFLLVFGLIALFVSAFLIYNTFSILVAQRTRELALTRAIGATRRQVRTSVLVEAVVVALVAATLGLLLGIGVAVGLRSLFAALGAPLPGSGLVLAPRTFLVAYGIGLIVTVVSAMVPAGRASKIPPVAAMRTDTTPVPKSLRRRGLVGAVLAVIAIGFAVLALQRTDQGTQAATLLGFSALAAIFAALALAPLAAQAFLPVLGAPFRSAVGRLAVENAQRNPRRTAATAGALMVGLTLISAMSVIASSTIKSTDAVVDSVIGADYVIFGTNFGPFPTTVAETVAKTPGVAVATPVRSAVAQVPGGDSNGTFITIVDPAAIGDVLKIKLEDGDMAALSAPGTIALDTGTAKKAGIAMGSTVNVMTLKGEVPMKVVALYEPSGFFSGYVAGVASADALAASKLDSAVYITTTPGSNPATVRTALEGELKAYPNVTLQDQSEFKAQIRDQINQLLAFIVALLVLAVLIAFLGIVNTLALSVFERTREIGLLRAVGTTRPQVRRMILIESVLIAVLGSLLGVLLGLAYGIGLQRVLASQGISELGINVGQLALFVGISAVGGVVAALWPARRAARLNVLQAIASE